MTFNRSNMIHVISHCPKQKVPWLEGDISPVPVRLNSYLQHHIFCFLLQFGLVETISYDAVSNFRGVVQTVRAQTVLFQVAFHITFVLAARTWELLLPCVQGHVTSHMSFGEKFLTTYITGDSLWPVGPEMGAEICWCWKKVT